jgi:hypothetical protein
VKVVPGGSRRRRCLDCLPVLTTENAEDHGGPRRGVNESGDEAARAVFQPNGVDVHQQADADVTAATPGQDPGIVRRQQRGGGLGFDRNGVRHQDAGAEARGQGPGLYEAEKDDGGPVQADEVIIAQAPDALPEVRLRDGRDLVHHQTAREPQPVLAVRLQALPEQRRFDRVGRAGDQCDRGCLAEPVGLDDHGRAGLAGGDPT